MAVQFATDVPAISAFDNRMRQSEQNRASRLQNAQAQYNYDAQTGADRAVREAYTQASSLPQPMQAPTQTQAPMAASSQLQQPQSGGIPTPPTPSQIRMQTPPVAQEPAQVNQGNVASYLPSGAAGQPSQPQQPMQAQAAQQAQQPILSPLDTPQFTQILQQKLASIPGGGAQIMALKKERDVQIAKIFEMIGNGNGEEARYFAQQAGVNIPQQFFANADLARGMAFSQKAYPDEPDKGQRFFVAYTSTQGDMSAKVQAGMASAGPPTSASMRQLQNSMALAQYQNTLATNKPVLMTGNGGGAYTVNAASGEATPVMTRGENGQQEAFRPTSGPNMRGAGGSAAKRFINVSGNLVDTQRTDANGNPLVVVDKNSNTSEASRKIFDSLRRNDPGADPIEQQAMAVEMAQAFKSGTQLQKPEQKSWLGRMFGGNESVSDQQKPQTVQTNPNQQQFVPAQQQPQPIGDATRQIDVVGPNGETGTIDASELNDALANGWRKK
jgi:hypothetical protein